MTPKQAAFVLEYLVDLNATQAAIRAGYSAETAGSTGWENLQKPEIQAAITEGQGERVVRTKVDQDYVIRGLSREAEAGDVDEPNGPRIRALELLGKHQGMFVERAAVEVTEQGPREVRITLVEPDKGDAAPPGDTSA